MDAPHLEFGHRQCDMLKESLEEAAELVQARYRARSIPRYIGTSSSLVTIRVVMAQWISPPIGRRSLNFGIPQSSKATVMVGESCNFGKSIVVLL